MVAPEESPADRRRLRIGNASIDDLTLPEALLAIAALVEQRRGGAVFTPNVDHLVSLEQDGRLRDAYAAASLSLADGQLVVWASHLLGTPLREKVSGSDLICPLMALAAEKQWRVYLLGGRDRSAALAAERLRRDAPGLVIVGIDPRHVDLDRAPAKHDDLIASINEVRPDIVLVALGCPKQEILIHRVAGAVRPAVCIGVGGGLDFLAGVVPRAPRWMSSAGLEWLYRLAHEPRRLWRRYLLRGPRFLLVLLRELDRRDLELARRSDRTTLPPAAPPPTRS